MEKQVDVSKIRTDGGTQPRTEIDDALVSEYAEAMKAGAEFPPVVAFWDGVDYWLADGFHRTHAARRAGSDLIGVEHHEGTKRDAILYSVGANAAHGQRRTNADKRKAVMTLLDDAEWALWSNVQIANQCGVSEHLVRSLRPSRSEAEPPPRTYTNKHGQTATMNTANIGRSQHEKEDVQREQDRPKSRGKGLNFAHEAIAALKRIPNGDGLRDEAFDMVAQWINDNR